MSRITEAHRINAHLPDSDLYDLTSDELALDHVFTPKEQAPPTLWPTCQRCRGLFPSHTYQTRFCGSCRLSEHEL